MDEETGLKTVDVSLERGQSLPLLVEQRFFARFFELPTSITEFFRIFPVMRTATVGNGNVTLLVIPRGNNPGGSFKIMCLILLKYCSWSR